MLHNSDHNSGHNTGHDLKMPEGTGTVKEIMVRFKKAKQLRELWRSLFQEAYEYAMPQKETFNFHSPGQSKNRHIYDSTAVEGVGTFASRLQASLTPPWQQWMDLIAGSEVPKDERDDINKKLESSTETFFAHLNHSDFSNQINESNQDLAVSAGAIMFEEGNELLGEPLFKFTSVPLSQLYLESPSGPRIETSFRAHETEARNLKKLWPEGTFTGDIAKIIDKKPDSKVKIINAVVKFGAIYHQFVIYENKKQLIFTQEFEENPFIIYRWSVVPGEVYGRGPVIGVLPDIRTVNKVKEFVLKNGAIQMTGMYTAVSDGTFNPYTINLAPGSIIPVSSNATSNPSLAALPQSGRLDLGQFIIADLQANIKRALFASPLGEIDDPVRTATEQMLRTQEMLRMAGASFGRLKTEQLEPIVRRGVAILKRNGRIADIKVDGREVTLQMQSPLAKAEAMEDFNNFQVWWAQMQTLPEQVVALGTQIENIPAWTARKLGLPVAELARTEDEIKEAAQVVLQQLQEGGALQGANPLGQ